MKSVFLACFKYIEVLAHNMGTVRVGGLREHEIEQIEAEAESNTDSNKSKYARQMLRAGMRLWKASGDLDEQELNRPLSEDRGNNISTSGQSNSIESGTKQAIYSNLSTSDPIQIESDDEGDDLVDLVIEDMVIEAIEELQSEGKIQHKPRKGYIKNE